MITVGDCFTRNSYGYPRQKKLQQQGKGLLIACPEPLAPREHHQRIDKLLDSLGVDRPVRVVGTDGRPVWGVLLRAARQEHGALVTLVNFLRQPQTVELAGDHPVKRIVNLFDNTEVTLPLALGSLEPVLLSIEWTTPRDRSGNAGNVPTHTPAPAKPTRNTASGNATNVSCCR